MILETIYYSMLRNKDIDHPFEGVRFIQFLDLHKSVFLNNNKIFGSFIDDLKKNSMKRGFFKILGAARMVAPKFLDALTLLQHV